MNVLAKNFYQRKCEIKVSEHLYIMCFLDDMKVLFRKDHTHYNKEIPVYFICDGFAVESDASFIEEMKQEMTK